MSTQLDAWRAAWKKMPDEVRNGLFKSRRGAPSKAALETVFAAALPDLPARLRQAERANKPIDPADAALIEEQLLGHTEELRTLTRIGAHVVTWLNNTPESLEELRGASKKQDIYFRVLTHLIRRAQGVQQLANLTKDQTDAWLRAYYHLDDVGSPNALADPVAIRQYLLSPGVADHVAAKMADAWGSATRTTTGDGTMRVTGWLPWKRPTDAERAHYHQVGASTLRTVAHDRVARYLGLTSMPKGVALRAPDVFVDHVAPPSPRPEDTEGTAQCSTPAPDGDAPPFPKPLDRSLHLRLTHANDQQTGSVNRQVTVAELVREEITRAAAPLGLSDAAERTALLACVVAIMYTTWPDTDATTPTTPNDPETLAIHEASHYICRAFRGVSLERLPSRTREALMSPSDTLGPRVWSRLHNAARDGRRIDPFENARSAFLSWMKDRIELGWDPRLIAPPRDDMFKDTTESQVSQGNVMAFEALDILSAVAREQTAEFVVSVNAGTATSAQWEALLARAAAAGKRRPSVSFGDVCAYIQELTEGWL